MFWAGIRYVCVVGFAIAGCGQLGKNIATNVSRSLPRLAVGAERPLSRVEVHLRAQAVAYPAPQPIEPAAATREQMIPVSLLVAGLERAEQADVPAAAVVVRSVASLPDIGARTDIASVTDEQVLAASPICPRPACLPVENRPAVRSAAKSRSKGKHAAVASRTKALTAKTAQKSVVQGKQKVVSRSMAEVRFARTVHQNRLAIAETPGTLMRRGLLGQNS